MSAKADAPQLEPLLPTTEHPQQGDNIGPRAKSNLWPCVFNLCKATVGAVIVSVPKSYSILGAGLGTVVLVLVALMTWFTIDALVIASVKTGKRTYSSVVGHCLGPTHSSFLDLVIVLTITGFEVAFLNIIGDVLVGCEGHQNGVLFDILPSAWRSSLLLSRSLVMAMLCTFVYLPLMSGRHLSGLGPLNALGLLALAMFGMTTLWLAGAAVYQGKAHAPEVLPNLITPGDSILSTLLTAGSVMSVLITAYASQPSVFPLMGMLKPFSVSAMEKVAAATMAIVLCMYACVGLAGTVAFGSDVEGDFLNNLKMESTVGLIGEGPAFAVQVVVGLAYVVSLVGSAVLVMFPLRDSFNELCRLSPSAQHTAFLPVTYTVIAVVYVLAVYVPSLWVVISFVGSVGGTLICFIYPSAVMLQTFWDQSSWRARSYKAVAVVVMAIGLMLFALGCLSVMPVQQPRDPDEQPAAVLGLGMQVFVGLHLERP